MKFLFFIVSFLQNPYKLLCYFVRIIYYNYELCIIDISLFQRHNSVIWFDVFAEPVF
jgi:hypothetical protein